MNKGARWRGLAATAAMLAVLAIVYAQAAQAAPVDFGAYLRAARDLRDGGSSYEVALTWRTARYATGSPQPQPTVETAYVYPPTLALALVPLTVLPVEVASAIWLAVLFGCILATAWCLAALLLPTRDGRFCLLVAALALGLVAFKPIRGALAFSKQVDPIILALLAAALLAFVRRRDGRAGLWLGLAVTIKPFLAVLALPLLWKRGYRVVAVAGLLAVGLGLVPLFALGLLGDYLAISAYYAGPAMGASPVSQSAWSFLLRTLTVQPYTAPLVEASWLVGPLQVVIGVALLVGLLTTISRSRGAPVVVQALEFGLAVTAMLVFGPLTEEHHLAYLAIGLATTLAAVLPAWDASAGARRIAIVAIVVVLFLMLPGTQVIAWGFYRY